MSTGQMVGQVNAAALISEVQGIADAEVAAAGASASSASASAAAALASEGAAVASADAADLSRTQAEVARDAAAAAGLVYATTAAGLAATASGGYFWVPAGAGQPDVLILYLDSAGTAVEQGRMVASERVGELASSLHPLTADTSSALFYWCDVNGAVVGYFDSASGLWLAGRGEALQTKLSELDSVKVQAGTGDDLYQWIDRDGRVVARLDSAAGLNLPGLDGTVQASAEPTKRDLLWAGQGPVVLAPGFTPMAATYPASERFIHAASPPALRPNQTRFTAYAFDWTTDPVNGSAVRRVRSNLNAPDVHNWAYEAITVNDPGGYFPTYQFRDISWMYDRALGKYWYAVPRFTSQAGGFLGRTFGIWSSTDGLVIDYVAFVDLIPGSPTQAWSPEFFVDDDGTVYVIITSNTETGGFFAYHLLRCTDTTTMASWEYVGKLTGTAFPTAGNGSINLNDPCLFKRGGVYYCSWKAETAAGGSHTVGQLGVAWSTSILGPYNAGSSFTAPGAVAIRGEGASVVELPQGSAYRFRLFFDNYLALTYGGLITGHSCYADTDDFTTFTVPKGTFLATYNRHFTAVIGV